jgi:MoxR-like ATPase
MWKYCMALTGEEKKIWQREYDKARRLAQKEAKQKSGVSVQTGNSSKSQVQNGQSKTQTLRKPVSKIPFASSSFTTEFRDIEEQNYILDKSNKNQNWSDHAGIFDILNAHLSTKIDAGLILYGEAGTGKTSAVEEWCRKNGHALVKFSCGNRTDIFELLVEKEIETDDTGKTKTIRDLGVIPKSMVIAQRLKICVLLFDEINALNNETQTDLNERIVKMYDGIDIPNTSIKVKLDPDCKVLVIGTMNPAKVNPFVNDLNITIKDRLNFFEVPRMSDNKIRKLVTSYLGSKSDFENQLTTDLMKLVQLVNANFDSQKGDSVNMPFSLRGLTTICQMYKEFLNSGLTKNKAIDQALKFGLVQKYEDKTQQNTVKSLISSVVSRVGGDVKQ